MRQEYYYNCLITPEMRYALFDGEGDIRVTAYSLDEIRLAKDKYGWGTIVKIKMTNRGIKFLRIIK